MARGTSLAVKRNGLGEFVPSKPREIEYVEPKKLKPASYNPRTISDEQLNAICRSIVEFGLVDPFIARREDGLIIGGHQRLKGVEKLLAGPFKYKTADGKTTTVKWELPGGKLPVIYLEHVSDQRAKMLNLALNRISGEWEHDQLAALLKSLSEEDLSTFDLQATGFSPAEITDYIDLAGETEELAHKFSDTGAMPKPSAKAPSLVLDFSSKELRDAVKTKIASGTKPEQLSGDSLARLLGVSARRAASSKA